MGGWNWVVGGVGGPCDFSVSPAETSTEVWGALAVVTLAGVNLGLR